ncbi:GAF domain-containing protein [Microcoleus sp. FACHB-672]|uniref:hybrid sensor histidine kinase/response regulator n=1 Tax=Microcoleus sp. FACHB-672 TaxID=2692825 RepID=UPI0018F0452D|nr:GAF domain-containing protein [Microcoleus sp. FACHB-672]
MKNALIQLLLVEDNCADVAILNELLAEDPAVPVQVTHEKQLTEVLNRLQTQAFDIILLDLSLPDVQGLETLLQVQLAAPALPIVVMTGLDNEELALAAVRQGAQDYLIKGQVNCQLLVRAIRYAIERKRTAEALGQQVERAHLLGSISQRIRQSLDLGAVLHTTVTEIRHFLHTDRVLVYRFNPDWSGLVVAESVANDCNAIYGITIQETCFIQQGYARRYGEGRVRAIENIYEAGLDPCHLKLLASLQVRANLVVPILFNEELKVKQGEKTLDSATSTPKSQLWGLLIAHQCRGNRSWQPWELDLLTSLATQVGIAIQQSELYQQVQQLNTGLETQVQERTAELQQALEQLQQALHLEAMLKRITDKVRDSLDEDLILPTAVRELALGLGAQSCQAALYDLEQGTATIRYEYSQIEPALTGHEVDLSDFAEIYSQLLPCLADKDADKPAVQSRSFQQNPPFQFCEFVPTRNESRSMILASALVDDQEVLGDLWLFKPADETFNQLEIRLVQQVANQCAIALRQARLYQEAQAQVKELERLNRLKDDFLCTVSHELRTPIANIKMGIQMLEVAISHQQSAVRSVLSAQNSPVHDHAYSSITDKTTHYFEVLHDECNREINLINDLLDLQRLNAGVQPLELSVIQMQNWIPHLVEPFTQRVESSEQILSIDISPALPPVVCDTLGLGRILTELLNNAHKYTPPGEHITLKVCAQEGKLQLQVINSGIEIPSTELGRIFDKFYRIPSNDPWKQGGTGLGLALVEKLSEHLGGTIQVASALGETCFTVELPLTPAAVTASALELQARDGRSNYQNSAS